jgi:hypothetical protein
MVISSNIVERAGRQSKLTSVTEWSLAVLSANVSGFLMLVFMHRCITFFQCNVVTDQNAVSLDVIRSKLLISSPIAFIAGIGCGWMVYRTIHYRLAPLYAFLKLTVIGISSASLILGLPLWGFFVFLQPPYPEMRITTDLPGYRIAAEQYWTTYESSWLDLVVTRQDGKQYRANIGFSDRELCTQLWTTRIATKIYYRCNAAPISPQTPYVDSTRLVLSVGRTEAQVEQALADLPFADPVSH